MVRVIVNLKQENFTNRWILLIMLEKLRKKMADEFTKTDFSSEYADAGDFPACHVGHQCLCCQ